MFTYLLTAWLFLLFISRQRVWTENMPIYTDEAATDAEKVRGLPPVPRRRPVATLTGYAARVSETQSGEYT